MARSGRSLAAEPRKPVAGAWLVLMRGPTVADRFEVRPGVSYVGRLPDVDLVLDSDLVSRTQAMIRNQDGRVTVEDLDSTNGTWIGPTRIQGESELHPGDVVRFADVSLTYALQTTEDHPGESGFRRWWVDLTKGAKTAILTAGALAAAVSAILGLWRPDPENAAKVNDVAVLETRVPLSKYEGQPPTITPATAARARGASGVRLVVGTVTVAADETGDETTSPEPSTASPTPTPTVSPSPSQTISPSIDPSPTGSSPTGATVSPSVDIFQSIEEVEPLEKAVDDVFSFPVRPVFAALGEPDAAAVPPATAMAAAALTGPGGTRVEAQVAARRLVKVLRQVRTKPVMTSDGVRKDPVGVLVDVDLELSGLRHETVSVRWQVRRTGKTEPLYGPWMRQVEAFRLTAKTQHDTAIVSDMWVPLPKREGRYVVRVQVTLDGSPLARGVSMPFS